MTRSCPRFVASASGSVTYSLRRSRETAYPSFFKQMTIPFDRPDMVHASQIALDLEFALADTRCLIPADLPKPDFPTGQGFSGNPVGLAPPAPPGDSAQTCKLADARAGRDGLDRR